MTVHALFRGQALCGFQAGVVPGRWPAGHVWVGVEPGQEVNLTENLAKHFCAECLPLVCSSAVLTIHVLHHGNPICGFEREAGTWPAGHTGVEVSDWSKNPNCKTCISVLNRTHTPKTRYDHIADDDVV